MKRLSVVLFAVLCFAGTMFAEEPKEPKKKNPADELKNKDLALDVAQAGPDFKVQGEFSGELTTNEGTKKFGAQIMAIGGGNFRAVYYVGGLPGDGWMGDVKLRTMTMPEWIADGKTDGDKTVFEKPYAATLTGETLTGKTDKGEAFECKKVMRVSPTMGATVPEGGKQLFDGTNLDNWKGGEIDERKLLTTTHGNALTKEKYKDFTLHVEYLEPFKPYGREQDRGNSGVYLQNRYECQVLDSFGRSGKDNEAGGIYHKHAPKVNMVFPPLSWQTYDIEFTAARYDDAGKKIKNAMVVSSKHNGVVIHENVEIDGPTGGGQKETPEPGEIQLQGHGNPVFYRNVWIVEKK